MNRSDYTYSKIYAFKWVGVWLFILILFLLRVILNFQKVDWWIILAILALTINLIKCIKRNLIPALNHKIAIEVNEEYIVDRGETIDFTSVERFVLYDSGIIAVILIEKPKKPKNILKWLDYWFTKLFYRSYILIDTRDVNVRAQTLFNNLVDQLDNPNLSVSR